jgi:hypothetical protein
MLIISKKYKPSFNKFNKPNINKVTINIFNEVKNKILNGCLLYLDSIKVNPISEKNAKNMDLNMNHYFWFY